MEKEKLLQIRYEEVRQQIRMLWEDLLTLNPLLSKEQRESLVTGIDGLKRILVSTGAQS